MKTAAMRLYTGFTKTKAAMVLAALVLYLCLVLVSGGNLLEVLLFAACVAGYILLPGLLVVRLLRGAGLPRGLRWPLAVLFGCAVLVLFYLFATLTGLLWVLRLVPPMLSLCCLAVVLTRESQKLAEWLRYRPAPHLWLLALLFAALVVLFAFAGVAKYARPTAVGDMLANQDLLWNVGNAESFKLGFPPGDIRFAGVQLRYHYLTELLAGILSLVSGIPAYNVVAFYLQPYVLAALVACLFCFARICFAGSLRKAVLFPFSLFLFGCASLWKILPNGWSVFNNSSVTHLITNINGQATAFVFLSLFLALFVQAVRARCRIGAGHALALLLAFLLLCLAKGPLAGLVAIAAVLALLVGMLTRQSGWRCAVLALAIAGIFAAAYALLFSGGADQSMHFSLSATLGRAWFRNILARLAVESPALWAVAVPVLWVVQSFLTMPGQFPLYLRSIGRDLRRFNTLPVERLLFQAAAVGGLAAYYLFDHPHFSQVYFLFGALFFINLLAVDGIDSLTWPVKNAAPKWRAAGKRVFVLFVGACAAVGLATNAFLYVHHLGSGARQLGRNLGLIDKYPYDVVITPQDEAAMDWLRGHMAPGELFATNRVHSGVQMEGISNVYTAFSGRQAYMEGFQYAMTNMGLDRDFVMARYAQNERLFSAATPPEEVLALCREEGIGYLVYSSQLPGSASQLTALELVLDVEGVQVYRVPAPGV